MNKRLSTYFMGLGVAFLSAFTLLIGVSPSVSAAVDNSPDCDTVAIIKCGVYSTKEMRTKAAKGDVPKVYNAFGISQNDLSGTFENGIVWRDGRVTVDGKVVATGAMTAGRNYGGAPIAGTDGAGKYSTSKFVDEGQTAYVKMKDGVFSFAVIKSCGNPVTAKPKKEEPKPAYECVRVTAKKISQTKYKISVKATATNGAKIKTYDYGFGDGYGATYSGTSYTYTYKKTGDFNVTVVPQVIVDGKTKPAPSPACATTITVEKAKQTPCVYDESLPKDSPDCVKPAEGGAPEVCEIEGKEDLKPSDALCVEDVVSDEPQVEAASVVKDEPETPQEISRTGPEAAVAGLFGSGALGYGIYSYALSRRHLINKFLGR